MEVIKMYAEAVGRGEVPHHQSHHSPLYSTRHLHTSPPHVTNLAACIEERCRITLVGGSPTCPPSLLSASHATCDK